MPTLLHTFVLSKAALTSHRTCSYVLVTEKNRLICKAHLRYTCNFITEFQGCTDSAMKIYIFYACTCQGCTDPVMKIYIFYACTCHLFARANLCYPTTRIRSYFSTIFAAHLCVYTHTMGCKRGFPTTRLRLYYSTVFAAHLRVYTRMTGCKRSSKEFTLFTSANLCYPTTRPCSYFSTIFSAHLLVYTRMMGCKRSLRFFTNSCFHLVIALK